MKALFRPSLLVPSIFMAFTGIYSKHRSTISMLHHPPINLDFSKLPTYTKKEVMDHYNSESRVWVCYKDGVYDITDFIKRHPGGEAKIMMAAGGSLEPFWSMYSFHVDNSVIDLLQQFRIGNLAARDIMKAKDIPDFSSLKKDKIEARSLKLNKLLNFPYCAEAPEKELIDYFYTPSDLFFVRNHNSIPEKIRIDDYTIEVFLLDSEEPLEFNLKDLLNKFSLKRKSTILACAGNRRSHMELDGEKPKGLQWKGAAIANGIWEGIAIKDLLEDLKIPKDSMSDLHLVVEGNDKDFQGENYSVSVPLDVAYEQGILAIKYNGKDIPFDHGYPLRLIVPGYVGVRNVKWVKSITISKKESQGPYQQRDYKIIKSDDITKVDLTKIQPVYFWEVNSAILTPANGAVILNQMKELEVKGWSYGTNGCEIFEVELSFDEGKSWRPVDSLEFTANDDGKVFGWTLWKYKLDLTHHDFAAKTSMPITVRARDLKGNVQASTIEEAWNFRGIMNNSYHTIKVNLI